MIRRVVFAALFLLLSLPVLAFAQTPSFLPADLYALTNAGVVERYAISAAGATRITPPDAFVLDFGVDALGERLAYRTQEGLFVVILASDGTVSGPVQIEGETAGVPAYRAQGDSVAWSPTGDALAYTTLTGARVYMDSGSGAVFQDLADGGAYVSLSWSPGGTFLAAETDQQVWWLYRRDGDSLSLTSVIPSSIGTTWVSNAELIFAPADGGLLLMNLAAANAQSTILDTNVFYRLPGLTADDRLVFFARPQNDPGIPEGFGILQRLARGARQVETIGQQPIALNGLRWAPGAQWMIAFQGGVLGLYDPTTGAGVPFAINNAVSYAWGPLALEAPPLLILPTATPPIAEGQPEPIALPTPGVPEPETETEAVAQALPTPPPAAGFVLDAAGWFLHPDTGGTIQVWRLPENGQPAFRFTGSATNVSEFAPSPNGQAAAYVAGGQLWLQRFEVRQPSLLAFLNGFAPSTPAFSPDGRQIAYVEEAALTGGIWLSTLGAEPTRILANIIDRGEQNRTYRRPQWSPDGTRLLLDVYLSGGVVSAVLDIATGTLIEGAFTRPDDPRAVTAGWLSADEIVAFVDANANTEMATGFYRFSADDLTEIEASFTPLPPTTLVRSVVSIDGQRFRALLADINYPEALLRVVDVNGTNLADVLVIPPLFAPRLSPTARLVAGYGSLTAADGFQQGPLVIIDLSTGAPSQLSQPASVWGFRWTR